jgi:diacylglycerol kinase
LVLFFKIRPMQRFFKSITFAIKGIVLVSGERNFRIQFFIMICAVCAGFYFSISSIDWKILLSFCALVLGAEGMNTSIERLCDLHSTSPDSRIAIIKDLSAGAVLLICIFAIIEGMLIFGKYFF